MKFLICALLNMTSQKTHVSPSRQLFFQNPQGTPEAADTNPEEKEDPDAHLAALEAAKDDPLALAAALENSLITLDGQAAERESDEVSHGKAQLEATLDAMGATAEEKADALGRYDKEFEDSADDLAEANERDQEERLEMLQEGLREGTERTYGLNLALADENIANMDLAIDAADGRIDAATERHDQLEGALEDGVSDLESSAKEKTGLEISWEDLKNKPLETLISEAADAHVAREASKAEFPDMFEGAALKESLMRKEPTLGAARKVMTTLHQRALELQEDQAQVATAAEEVTVQEDRKQKLVEKRASRVRQKETIISDRKQEVASINDGTYMMDFEGQYQSITDRSQFLADNNTTAEERELLDKQNQDSGEMVRELTLEVAFNRIREELGEAEQRLADAEDKVSQQEDFLDEDVSIMDKKAREVCESPHGIAWSKVRDIPNRSGTLLTTVRDSMQKAVDKKNEGNAELREKGIAVEDIVLTDEAVADEYRPIAVVARGYDRTVDNRKNNPALLAHLADAEEARNDITALEHYLDSKDA